jgi:hypothetical protein
MFSLTSLRVYFGFSETILRYKQRPTKDVKCKTGGLQGDSPEFMVFCHVTLHLWGRVFKMFPDLRGLAFVDDGNIIGRLSQDLKLISASNPVFKLDVNLDFILGKTMFLAKGTTVRNVYERAEFFLQNDPSLQDIAQDFTFNMFSVKVIEILGTPIGKTSTLRNTCIITVSR